jgi:hypothetical protein
LLLTPPSPAFARLRQYCSGEGESWEVPGSGMESLATSARIESATMRPMTRTKDCADHSCDTPTQPFDNYISRSTTTADRTWVNPAEAVAISQILQSMLVKDAVSVAGPVSTADSASEAVAHIGAEQSERLPSESPPRVLRVLPPAHLSKGQTFRATIDGLVITLKVPLTWSAGERKRE